MSTATGRVQSIRLATSGSSTMAVGSLRSRTTVIVFGDVSISRLSRATAGS